MGMFDFLASDQAGPSSYSAMEMRRKIAMQMLSQRKGYPKTLGEGLTAIGDSLGDIGTMRMLARQEALLQQQRGAGAAAAERGEPTAPSPPGPLSEAEPTAQVASAQTPAAEIAEPRDAIAGVLAARPDAQDARLSEVTGMGPTGAYSYPPTASLGRAGDVQPDVPDVTGVSPKVGAAAADTLQSAPPMPPPLSGAIGAPPEAAYNRPIVRPDIRPMSAAPALVPGAQLAQMSTSVPPPNAPPMPVPNAAAEPRVQTPPQFAAPPQRPADPVEPQKTPRQLYNERAMNTTDDPFMQQVHKNIIAQEEKLRADEYARRVEKWKSDQALYQSEYGKQQDYMRDTPKRELELQKMEDERQQRDYSEKLNRRLGGIPQEVFVKGIEKSHEASKGIPLSAVAIGNARQSLNDKMFTGSTAEINLTAAKLMKAAGFPADPRIPATEAFRSYISPIIAQSRQALAGGANISDADMRMAMAAAGGDIKLDRETFPKVIDALERMNTVNAAEHQKKLETFAGGDPERQRALYGTYGLPMEQIVPRAFAERLRQHADNPEAAREFDNYFHTPGLSRSFIGRR